jgi:holo-[acyl-carrier protein] synthase
VPGVGIDLLEIDRLELALRRYPGLAERVFTAAEREYAAARARPGRHLAARFAAKEAVVKALGLRGFGLGEIEVLAGEPPTVRLRGRAAEAAAGRQVDISLTHSRESAAAIAIAGERPGAAQLARERRFEVATCRPEGDK